MCLVRSWKTGLAAMLPCCHNAARQVPNVKHPNLSKGTEATSTHNKLLSLHDTLLRLKRVTLFSVSLISKKSVKSKEYTVACSGPSSKWTTCPIRITVGSQSKIIILREEQTLTRCILKIMHNSERCFHMSLSRLMHKPT